MDEEERGGTESVEDVEAQGASEAERCTSPSILPGIQSRRANKA